MNEPRRGPPSAFDRLAINPFWVLDLPPSATGVEVARAAKKIEMMLAAGAEGAELWSCPFGSGRRDLDLVRWAQHELREPPRRVFWEFLASPLAPVAPGPGVPAAVEAALGWRRTPP